MDSGNVTFSGAGGEVSFPPTGYSQSPPSPQSLSTPSLPLQALNANPAPRTAVEIPPEKRILAATYYEKIQAKRKYHASFHTISLPGGLRFHFPRIFERFLYCIGGGSSKKYEEWLEKQLDSITFDDVKKAAKALGLTEEQVERLRTQETSTGVRLGSSIMDALKTQFQAFETFYEKEPVIYGQFKDIEKCSITFVKTLIHISRLDGENMMELFETHPGFVVFLDKMDDVIYTEGSQRPQKLSEMYLYCCKTGDGNDFKRLVEGVKARIGPAGQFVESLTSRLSQYVGKTLDETQQNNITTVLDTYSDKLGIGTKEALQAKLGKIVGAHCYQTWGEILARIVAVLAVIMLFLVLVGVSL